MRLNVTFAAAALAAVTFCAGTLSAQSLGDVARKEEARRKAVKTPGKVYTNDSLHPDSSSSPDAPSVPAEATPANVSPPAQPQPGDKPPADQKKDEKYWKDRLSDARTALDRSKTFAEALQSRINVLTADFSARSDPAQRAVIERDRQKALAELDRVNQDIKDQTKAITDTQEEARKAGVPAAWYR